jgi:hypothetical protein
LISAHAPARHVSDLDGHHYAPEIYDPANDVAVEHGDVQQHDHDVGMPGVIHVDDDGGASSQNPHATLIRSVHDLDLLIPAIDLPPGDEAGQRWAVTRPGRFDSHVSPPLERPPQV